MANILRSLVGEFWGGFCPSCPEPVDMKLNTLDQWECPRCHLEIDSHGSVVVLPTRGVGSYMRSHGSPVSANHVIPPQVGRIVQDLRC